MLSAPKNVSSSSKPSGACMRVCHLNLASFFSSREQPSRSAAAGRAALRRALESAAAGWEPPCATVGAARVVHQALPTTVRRLKRGSPSKAEPTVHDHTACASSLRWRACLQPSVVWILQASHAEVEPPAKKTRNENPAPSKDAEQPSSNEMWSPPVCPIWFGP